MTPETLSRDRFFNLITINASSDTSNSTLICHKDDFKKSNFG